MADSPPGLELKLFGPMEARVGGLPLPHLRSRKGLWLLALLALRGGRAVDRDWIAGTLWPESDEADSRRSLRQSLHDLRAALGDEARRLTSDEPRTLRLTLDGAFVDVLEFDAAMQRGDEASLQQAIQLYRGPLLEDCGEDWALEGRRHREESLLSALEKLASRATERAEHGRAANHLRQAIGVDPYREDILRGLMETLAADGSRAAALLAYREFRARLAHELAGEPSEETIALFQRLKSESAAVGKAQPPATGTKVRDIPFVVPIPLTELIGRETEVGEIVGIMSRVRLCTLTGTGGVGKTRLSISVATELQPTFNDGVFFVDLAPLDNPALLPDVVRATLGAPACTGAEEPLEVVSSFIGVKRMLIVLDNCEHLGQTCGALAEALLRKCRGLSVLATSRQTLGITGEIVWRVPSLAVPEPGRRGSVAAKDIHHIAAFQDFAAIKLFRERARSSLPSFELSRANSLDVARICTRLDGIPLAIELAAARVKAIPVDVIARKLNDRFRMLLGDRSMALNPSVPRHQTLRASIDWSYDLLSQREQALLQRLSIFSGGWTLDAAEVVCSGEPLLEWEVLGLLTSLVEKSLVVYQPDEDRYRLLETIRQYLVSAIDNAEKLAVSERHLRFFRDLAETAEQELTGPNQVVWMDRLEEDHDNLRSALSFSLSSSEMLESGLALSGAIWRFWDTRGYVREARQWYHIQLEQTVGWPANTSRGKAVFGAAALAFGNGDLQAAKSHYQQCLDIRRSLGDRRGGAYALRGLGLVAAEQGDYETARPLYEESLTISREVGDVRGVGVALNQLGILGRYLGDPVSSRAYHQENLEIRQALGDQGGIAIALSNLGNAAEQQGDHEAAKRFYSESLAIDRKVGNRQGIALSLGNLGINANYTKDFARARSLILESIASHWELGNLGNIPAALEDLAASQAGLGFYLVAATLWGSAERLREEVTRPRHPNFVQASAPIIDNARQCAGDTPFEHAWACGRAMSMEQAISFALS